jgi:predicted secreted Zn-dependent protease
MLSITALFASPIISEQTVYYKVVGENRSDLRKQLNELGPITKNERYDAQVTWSISWTYNWSAPANKKSCKIDEVHVIATIQMTLPQWEDELLFDIDLQSQWDDYLKNLITHEQGHVENGKKAAQEVEEVLLQVPEQYNCDLLNSEIDRVANKIINTHNDWDVTYDKDTQHGKTQGAVFP